MIARVMMRELRRRAVELPTVAMIAVTIALAIAIVTADHDPTERDGNQAAGTLSGIVMLHMNLPAAVTGGEKIGSHAASGRRYLHRHRHQWAHPHANQTVQSRATVTDLPRRQGGRPSRRHHVPSSMVSRCRRTL